MVFLSGVNAIRQYISKRLHTIVAMAMVMKRSFVKRMVFTLLCVSLSTRDSL